MFIVVVALFMLIHETFDPSPQEIVIGAALVMLGIPAAFRIHEREVEKERAE